MKKVMENDKPKKRTEGKFPKLTPDEKYRLKKKQKAIEKQTEETALRRLRRAYMRKHPDAGYKEMQEAGLF